MMTIEEAKKMVGTEFIYCNNGEEVLAYVKAFDPCKGLTCYSLESCIDLGLKDLIEGKTDISEDGTFCVIAYDFGIHSLIKALNTLEEISDTGKYIKLCTQIMKISCAF